MSLRELIINSADALILTAFSLLFGIEAVISPANFVIYVTLCVTSAVVFFIQYFLEREVGVVSGLLRCLEGGSE